MTADPAAWNFVVVSVDAKVPYADVVAYAAAQQRQVREHFAPTWQLPTTTVVRAAYPGSPRVPGEVVVYLHDQATAGSDAGTLAYHTTEPDGTPACPVFCGLAEALGEHWTKAASHEVLETLGDPRLRRCVEVSDGSIWDVEVCDRVEQDEYQVDGVWLSNFNTPECFEPPDQWPPGMKFDWMALSTAPNQVRPGGYAQKYAGSKWVNVGELSAYRAAVRDAGVGRGARRASRHAPWWRVAARWLDQLAWRGN